MLIITKEALFKIKKVIFLLYNSIVKINKKTMGGY